MRSILLAALSIGAAAALNSAAGQGPLPIREAEKGLLAQAATAPALARLAAYGEFPGASMVDAEIRMEDSRLVYVFSFQTGGDSGLDQVMVDGLTGQIYCVEYVVDEVGRNHYAISGPAELVSLVEASFKTAREAARSTVEHGKIMECRFRVRQSSREYVFDIRVGEDASTKEVVVDAITGAVISSPST